ncbi:hypothetical protein [Gilliamella apicola]
MRRYSNGIFSRYRTKYK